MTHNMNFNKNKIYWNLLLWALLLYVSSIMDIGVCQSEEYQGGRSISITNKIIHKNGGKHQKPPKRNPPAEPDPEPNMHMTLNNLMEETEIPVGYQNPHERVIDIVGDSHKFNKSLQSGRSQTIQLRWPKSGVPIFYAHDFTPRQECFIKLAIDRLNQYSCIPLILHKVDAACAEDFEMEIDDCLKSGNTAWTDAKIKKEFQGKSIEDHIVISKKNAEGRGCYSPIGRLRYKQVINLSDRDPDCFENNMGSVMHEVLHSLGYNHEHTRIDRDKWVTIVTRNILSEALPNFDKSDEEMFKDFGPYDFFSIMHYSAYANSFDGTSKTILVKRPQFKDYYRVGQRVDLTQVDKTKIRSVTRCAGSTYSDHLKAVNKLEAKETLNIADRKNNCWSLR